MALALSPRVPWFRAVAWEFPGSVGARGGGGGGVEGEVGPSAHGMTAGEPGVALRHWEYRAGSAPFHG